MPPVADISCDRLEIMSSLYYNENLINYQMDRLGISPEKLAELARVSAFSVTMARSGHLGTFSRLKRITDVLKIKWKYITDTDLPESEFHRAVLTNGDRRGRTVKQGSKYVGVRRPL